MAFKVILLAHALGAEPERYRCAVETIQYELFVVVVTGRREHWFFVTRGVAPRF